jgi:hypothetical protein
LIRLRSLSPRRVTCRASWPPQSTTANDAAIQRQLQTLQEINRINELNQRLQDQQQRMQRQNK